MNNRPAENLNTITAPGIEAKRRAAVLVDGDDLTVEDHSTATDCSCDRGQLGEGFGDVRPIAGRHPHPGIYSQHSPLAIKLHFYSKLTVVRGLAQRRQHGRRGREAVGEQRSAGHASKVLTGGSASLLPAASRSRLAY